MNFLVDAQRPPRAPRQTPVDLDGNISNRDLEALVVPLIPDIVREFQTHSFLELGRAGIVIRG